MATLPKMPAAQKMGAPGSVPDNDFNAITAGPRGPYSVTVTPEDIARWGRIYEDNNPWYSGSSPYGGPIAPPSILYYPSQMFLGRHLIGATPGATLAGGFARYSLESTDAIPVGKELIVTGEVTDIFTRRGRGYVTYKLEATHDGKVVQRHWKNWAFGITDDEAAKLPTRNSDPRDDLSGDTIRTIGPVSMEITIAKMADFEGPGEVNTHTDPEMAKRAGGRPPLAQGALSFGLLSRMMTEAFGQGYITDGTLDVRFLDRVYVGNTETAKGEVFSESDGVAKVRVWVEKEDGTQVTAGLATARI